MPYLVHKAPVLPALTVQVAIQSDVCKGKAEVKSPQSSQGPRTGLWPPPLSLHLWTCLGLGKWKSFPRRYCSEVGASQAFLPGLGKEALGRKQSKGQVKRCPFQEAFPDPSLFCIPTALHVWGIPNHLATSGCTSQIYIMWAREA